MSWTHERLEKLSHVDRHNLWLNAKRLSQIDLVDRIEASGLPYLDPKGLALDSPAGRAMYKVIFSQAGKDAGAAATRDGKPALAYIEPLLIAEMGPDYQKQREATVQAGYLVANMMENNGYDKTGTKRKMPEGSVAKTAEFFKRKS